MHIRPLCHLSIDPLNLLPLHDKEMEHILLVDKRQKIAADKQCIALVWSQGLKDKKPLNGTSQAYGLGAKG